LQRLEQGLFQPESGVRTGRGLCRCLDGRQGRSEAAIRPEQLGRFDQGHIRVSGEGPDAPDEAVDRRTGPALQCLQLNLT